MAKKSQIQQAIDELVAKREAVMAEAHVRAHAIDGAIDELMTQQARTPKRRDKPKAGPVAVAAGA